MALDGDDRLDSASLVVQLSPTSKLALSFQLVTVQRKGEVVGAELSEICLVSGWWTIPAEKAKNGQAYRVALSSLALELLQEIKGLGNNSLWLFPSEKTNSCITGAAIDHALRRCTFKEIKPFTPHDLRRTAASHMTSMGVSRLVVRVRWKITLLP